MEIGKRIKSRDNILNICLCVCVCVCVCVCKRERQQYMWKMVGLETYNFSHRFEIRQKQFFTPKRYSLQQLS